MCVMDIMNVLRTGMNMCISHIHVWLCNSWTLTTGLGIMIGRRFFDNHQRGSDDHPPNVDLSFFQVQERLPM